ncbi:SH3 domain-containing protein [Calditerrivibrio nitroreducens]|uniref:NLP/P60 protein n=1 Tax=Calditerrivibrio nitroreducens (strain DSM 19672 / NBRC 101217 / Yu37-1) TaxID=768670 RepID=E4TEY0_CALNY|nr:SH3 domain-containing protein [Calditerrivibrio nitroreducens]ADR18386.1 NLP/P60 protein [Calditerrivibrio nitroreducens DSM 19672]
MFINLKNFFILIFFANLSYAEIIDISSLNHYIYTHIEYSADLEHFPTNTEKDIKKRLIEKELFDPKIKFIDNQPIISTIIENLLQNRNLSGITAVNNFGFTKKRSNIKMFPTNATLTYKPDDKIDRNQYSLIEPFEPVIILHTSKDGEWFFIQTFFTRGWINKNDLTNVSYDNFRRYFNTKKIVIVRDRVKIGDLIFGAGSRIPIEEEDEQYYTIIKPDSKLIKLKKDNDISIFPVVYNYEIAKKFLDSLLDQPYDWGGKKGYRDCSSLVMDLFRIFGVDLPRNSKQQAEVGEIIWERGDKKSFFIALDKAEPFCTFIHMKGHIIIYGGKDKDDYLIYHAVERFGNILYNKVVKQHIISDNTNLWSKAYRITTICRSKEKRYD